MNTQPTPIRVSFLFASHGIGGAEQSMLRLMRSAHPHTLNCEVIFSGADNAEMADALHALDVPHRRVGRLGGLPLVRAFRAFQPDVAYLFGQIRSLAWTLAARLAGVPVVVGAERSTLDRRVDVLGRRFDRFVIDHYISNSRKAAHDLVERVGVPERRVHVVYNGLAFPDQPARPVETDLPLGRPTVVCVANVQARKGQVYLLRAIRQLRRHYPDARAVLVGKDLSNGEVLHQFEAEGLHECYTWTGYTSNVRGYLARADIFVLPSLLFEGVPTAILEAMADGVPVIASDVSGVSELVIDGQTGLLVPPGDVAALTRALDMLLSQPQLRQRLTTGAQTHIRQQHTMAAMLDGHVAVFRQALQAKRSPLHTSVQS